MGFMQIDRLEACLSSGCSIGRDGSLSYNVIHTTISHFTG